MHNRRQTLRRGVAIGLAAGLWNTSVFATVYLEIEEARKLLLPQAASFQPWPIALDAQALATIAQATQTRVPTGYAPTVWVGLDAQGARVGFVLADHVIGRYEWIDYAAGYGADGTLTQVEVLAYRESHGAEIRNLAWRRQFSGRKGPAQMRFNEEIRNISGATLSCQHVTEGVQRLSALVQQQLHRTS
jgi:Na+-translocating ferredoxin:NAD+ oxidoreductase RnfG subunit